MLQGTSRDFTLIQAVPCMGSCALPAAPTPPSTLPMPALAQTKAPKLLTSTPEERSLVSTLIRAVSPTASCALPKAPSPSSVPRGREQRVVRARSPQGLTVSTMRARFRERMLIQLACFTASSGLLKAPSVNSLSRGREQRVARASKSQELTTEAPSLEFTLIRPAHSTATCWRVARSLNSMLQARARALAKALSLRTSTRPEIRQDSILTVAV